MVLGGRPPGRVGRRRISLEERLPPGGALRRFRPVALRRPLVASTVMSAGRPPRPSRRPDGRSGPGDRAGRPGSRPAAKSRGQRPPGGQRSSGRQAAVVRRRAAPAVQGVRRPERTQTAAERRAAEVNAKRAPRPPRDPDAERAKIEARTLEQWIDEGALRAEATERGRRGPRRRPGTARRIKGVAAGGGGRDLARRPATAGGPPCSPSASARPRRRSSGSASTRPGASPPSLLRELADVAAVHEVLGLAAYRIGALEAGRRRARAGPGSCTRPSSCCPCWPTSTGPSAAGPTSSGSGPRCGRPRRRQEVLAEARIVAAGAQADQGDLKGALRTMGRAAPGPEAGPRPPPAPVVRARRPARPGRRHARGDPLVRARRHATTATSSTSSTACAPSAADRPAAVREPVSDAPRSRPARRSLRRTPVESLRRASAVAGARGRSPSPDGSPRHVLPPPPAGHPGGCGPRGRRRGRRASGPRGPGCRAARRRRRPAAGSAAAASRSPLTMAATPT